MKSRVNLSISNSKDMIKKKRVFKVIIFLAIFFLINSFIGNQFSKTLNNTNAISQVKWNEFYKAESNSIDVIILGSSHAYRSFDPGELDKGLGINSFNMGSPLQKPVESYYILKETLKSQKPKMVVFDVYWGIFNSEPYFLTKTWNYDLMKPSFNRLNYLINVFDINQYFFAISNTVRYHGKVGEYIKNMGTDSQEVQGDSDYAKDYKGKGFVINNEVVTKEELAKNFEGLKKQNGAYFVWDKKQLNYLYKIINLCKKENIPLLLVTAPVAPTYFEGINKYNYDYDKIHEKVSEIAHSNGLRYIDYNKINDEMKILSDSDFSDTNHLNYTGVKKMNKHFINLVKDMGIEKELQKK